MKVEKIESIRRKFHNEWLLIAVDKMDKATTTALSGRLIAHSPVRDEVYKKSMEYKGLCMVDYSEDKLPEGTAILFLNYA